MTREEAIAFLYLIAESLGCMDVENYTCKDGERMCEAIKVLEQEPCDEYSNYKYPSDVELTVPNTATSMPCGDAISRQAAIDALMKWYGCEPADIGAFGTIGLIEKLPSVNPQPKTGQYEKHIDHTDCIWYGSDSGCPVTCSQYRDGWNDAMDYIFKNGKGYQPYRHDG